MRIGKIKLAIKTTKERTTKSQSNNARNKNKQRPNN
jgi:hypothetical protein